MAGIDMCWFGLVGGEEGDTSGAFDLDVILTDALVVDEAVGVGLVAVVALEARVGTCLVGSHTDVRGGGGGMSSSSLLGGEGGLEGGGDGGRDTAGERGGGGIPSSSSSSSSSLFPSLLLALEIECLV